MRAIRGLSTDVREPWTAPGSGMLLFLARFCSSQRTENALVGRLWLDVTNVMASKRSKKEKLYFRLPSVVHERLFLTFSRASVTAVDAWLKFHESYKNLITSAVVSSLIFFIVS